MKKILKSLSYKSLYWLIPLWLLAIITSCSSSKYIPENEYLLQKVEIKADVKGFDISSVAPYIRQKANSKWFSLFKIPLATYSMSGKDSTKWINRTLKNMGEAPVIFDSVQARLSVDDLRNTLKNMGYMHATVDLTTKVKGKKITASYMLHPGHPFYINDVKYDIQDHEVATVLSNYFSTLPQKRVKSHVLTKGTPFTVDKLDEERKLITEILLDSGYYKFHKDFIKFDADTALNNTDVDLTLHLLKFRANNDSPEVLHPRYIIGKINYSTDNGKLNLSHNVLDNATLLKEGKLYSHSDLEETYRNFGRLSAVRYTSIQFHEDQYTNNLNCDIQLNTNKPSTISFQPEGTNTAGDLGAAMSLTYQNRNVFHGSELFSAEVRGAFEAITGLEGYRDKNFMEWSAETKLQFPRLLVPFVSRKVRQRSTAFSELSLSWDMQNRPEFHRRVFSTAWRYRWSSPDTHMNYRLDIPDLNYVYMPWISETFKTNYLDNADNRNAILRYNYEDLFIMKLGFGLTYNDGIDAFRFNIETAGNFLDAFSRSMKFHINSSGRHTLFGIAYAQYAKLDFDYTRLLTFDTHNSLALHADFGIAYPYGNSNILPFEKRYFSGGANSVRGWSVRELGPGSFKGKDGRIDFINQTGDMKLDLNAEYRTFLFWKFNGAVFVDAGNIWTLRNYPDQPGGQFKWKSFLKQIAVAYGMGLRLNFNYFILRFDMGMKAINPAYSNSDEHYAIIHPDFSRDFTFHFAVGLPF